MGVATWGRERSLPRKAAIAVVYLVVCVGLAVAIAGVPSRDRGPARRVTTEPTTSVPELAAGTAASSSVPDVTTTTAAPARPSAQVKVRFANGSTVPGAAVTVGERASSAGFVVVSPAPSPDDPVDITRIWFREGWEVEAAAVADALGVDRSNLAAWADGGPDIGDASVFVLVADDLARRPSP